MKSLRVVTSGALILGLIGCSATKEKMVTIKIRGTVELDFGEVDTSSGKARSLAGHDSGEETLAEYIGHHGSDEPFKALGLTGGQLILEFDKVLWVAAEYRAARHLTAKELAWLIDYTQGQWSDGVGTHPEAVFGLSEEDPYIDIAPVDQRIALTTNG